MPKVMLAKLTSKGQMTIPQSLRSRLKLRAGDYVVLRPARGGIFISKASVQPEADADEALKELVSEVLTSAVAEETPAASPSAGKGDTQEEDERIGPRQDAQRMVAELTLAYLGGESEYRAEESNAELDSDGIARAIAHQYGTDDVVQIIEAARGRGEVAP